MKFLRWVLLLALLAPGLVFSQSRSYGEEGTATTTNSQKTIPFRPAAICVENTGATNDLFFDYTDGIAVAVGNSTNLIVNPSTTLCADLSTSGIGNLVVGFITAASTTTYTVNALAR